MRPLLLHLAWMERSLTAQEPQQLFPNQDVPQVLRLFCILARSCAPPLPCAPEVSSSGCHGRRDGDRAVHEQHALSAERGTQHPAIHVILSWS